MKRKRNIVIDKKFQHGTAVSVSGLVLVFSLIIFSVQALHSVNTERSLASAVTELDAAIDTEDNIVNAFLRFSSTTGRAGLILNAKKVSLDHEKSMNAVRQRIAAIRGGILMNYAILALLGAVFVIQGALLYRHCLRLTHRIAGPMHVIRQCLEEISEGKKPDFRPLRTKDEFGEVYKRLERVAGKLKVGKLVLVEVERRK